jgi:hypothetical protein
MKKIVFMVVFAIVLGSCFAQNSNNERRIFGTWTQIPSIPVPSTTTWIFNPDGTGVSDDGSLFKYAVTDTILILATVDSDGNIYRSSRDDFYKYSVSSDGKSLILEYYNSDGDKRALWLTKR